MTTKTEFLQWKIEPDPYVLEQVFALGVASFINFFLYLQKNARNLVLYIKMLCIQLTFSTVESPRLGGPICSVTVSLNGEQRRGH